MTARHLRAVDSAPRFGIGVRVSQVMGRSGERFHSPETQENAARAAVERAGGVVDETVGVNGVFTDLDVSGKTAPSDRPGMGAALELVRSGRLAGVAVYDLSRWSRDTVSGLRELQEIAALGGQVISAAETIDVTTPAGIFGTTVQLAAQQLRRDEASKAWKATHQARHDRGLPHGKVPLGYLAKAGEVEVDPDLGPVITWAFESYATGTVSQVDIAKRLTEIRGVLTRQGVVSRLLRNPFFAGLLTYNGDTKVGRHTPLTTVRTFERVQARMAADLFSSPRTRAPVSPLVGLWFCACGKPLYRRGRGSDARGPARLRCSDPTCPGVGAPFVHEVEEVTRAHVEALARGIADRTPEVMARISRQTRAAADLRTLEIEEKALVESIGRAGALLAREVLDEDGHAATVLELQRQLKQVRARLAQAGPAPVVTLERLESAADLLSRHYNDLTALEARAAFRLFITRVIVRRSAYRGEPTADRVSFEEP